MFNLLLGLLLFLGIHSISIVAEPLRDRLVAKTELGWKIFYSLISLVGLLLIIKGYAQARLNPTLIYIAPYWVRHITALLMLPVFILFLAPYFPGKIAALTKHPQLIAVMLWAVSHLLVNGNFADLLLFTAFLLWAITDLISMNHRISRPLPGAKKSRVNDIFIVVAGLVIYVVFVVYLHSRLIGMPLIS